MTIFLKVIDIINNSVMAILTIGFIPQIIYVLLCFLKPKKYAKSNTYHKFGIIIPARNEEKVIFELIDSLKNQNYPKEQIEIFVVADNCTDNTAEVARQNGAVVFERNEPEKKRKGYALQYGFNQIKEIRDDIDAFVIFDADNIVDPNFITKMNDAFTVGVKLARGYSNSKNLTDNMTSCSYGLYYIRDCRFSCQVRSALGTDQNMNGSGMMISADIIENNGWDCFNLCEDAEFTFKRMLEGYHTKYVSDAMYYEEQTTTLKDTFNRNTRMGHGLNKLFFTSGFKMLGKFFITGRYGYLDMFLTLLFMPIAFLCCFWFPLYYGFQIVWASIHYSSNPEALHAILKMAAIALTCIFYAPFVIQTLLVIILEKKKLKYDKFSTLIKASFVFPFFMIFYMLSIAIGIITKPKWKSIKHDRAISANTLLRLDDNIISEKDNKGLNENGPSENRLELENLSCTNETSFFEQTKNGIIDTLIDNIDNDSLNAINGVKNPENVDNAL